MQYKAVEVGKQTEKIPGKIIERPVPYVVSINNAIQEHVENGWRVHTMTFRHPENRMEGTYADLCYLLFEKD